MLVVPHEMFAHKKSGVTGLLRKWEDLANWFHQLRARWEESLFVLSCFTFLRNIFCSHGRFLWIPYSTATQSETCIHVMWLLLSLTELCNKHALPGQGKSLHDSALSICPEQSFPLCWGAGFVQPLEYAWVPVAQDFEQDPSVCHSVPPPWTKYRTV